MEVSDSTAVTMKMLETLESLPPPIRKTKRCFVTCVNTLVEAPPVINHVHHFTTALKEYVLARDLPVEVVELTPDEDQTFWVNLIGRGYPTPVKEFRWCTDKMKIRPRQSLSKKTWISSGTPGNPFPPWY